MASSDSETTRAIESIDDFNISALGGIYGGGPEFSGDFWNAPYYGVGVLAPPYFQDNQKRGEALPYYITERQLKIIRDRQRRICAENEFARCAIEVRKSYIVGSGLTYRVLPLHEDESDVHLAKETQRVVDLFLEINDMAKIENETIERNDRDGETFLRLFENDHGLIRLRFVEPELVRSPSGETDPGKSFGIETDPGDVNNIRGYHIVERPLHNPTPTFVKADKIVHDKRNVDSSAKRGMPLLYPVESNLRRAEELLAAMSVTAKTRAKIALIRHIEGSNKGAAAALKGSLETGQTFDPITGGVTNVEQLRLGSILTSSKNITYEMPSGNGSAAEGVEILRAELRAVAARCILTEAMISADASGGTNSSMLVAEAPVARNFEREQKHYCGFFGASRVPGRESLVWRQIKAAVRVGVLPPEAMTRLRVVVTAPDIISRDPDKAAAADKVYFDMGVVSPQRICESIGGNWEQTKKERKDAGLPDVNAMLGGMPGDQGISGSQPQAPGSPGQGEEGDGEPGEFEFDASEFDTTGL